MSEHNSAWTRVRVVEFESMYLYPQALSYREHEDSDLEEACVSMGKPADTLARAQKGDIVEVVFDYRGWIVGARRITGTLRGRVEALEQALKAAGIDIPPNTLEKP